MGPSQKPKMDWIRTIIYIVVYVSILILGAIVLLPAYWYVWLFLLVVGLSSLVMWHTGTYAYRCPKFDHKFGISALVNFISPHVIGKSGGWKYLKCPECHVRSRMSLISKDLTKTHSVIEDERG